MKMKRLFIILGGLVLVAVLAMPLLAQGPGWGVGSHMRVYQGSDRGSCWGLEKGYGELTTEQRSQLEELDKKFYRETTALRNEIWEKSSELNTLLISPDPDPEKIKALHRALSDLRAEMDEKHLTYELEVRKLLPELRSSGRYSMGDGHHRRGYGSGRCW
jgi:Spy/CpxP family protein refolding chaperone